MRRSVVVLDRRRAPDTRFVAVPTTARNAQELPVGLTSRLGGGASPDTIAHVLIPLQ